MAYLKPQSPLQDKKSGDYFYPLTTVDQVIMEDGSRLNSVIDGAIVPTTTTSDDGKILKVVNGKPAWVSVGDIDVSALPNAEEATF